jgi:hypothetical protein
MGFVSLGHGNDSIHSMTGGSIMTTTEIMRARQREINQLRAEYDDALRTITDMQSKFEAVSVENERLRAENESLKAALRGEGNIDNPFITPWSDCKVAFDVDCDDEQVWEAFAFLPTRSRYELPTGWSIDETDRSGARTVVVFRVEGVPLRITDGGTVALILHDISKKGPVQSNARPCDGDMSPYQSHTALRDEGK